MRVEPFLEQIASETLEKVLGERAPALLRPTQDPKHGDYQINGVMPLAKRLKRPPRELAQPVAEALAAHPSLDAAEVAGPGFINLRLSLGWVAERLQAALADRERDGVPATPEPRRIVVDFSGPNIAKEPHVGHLRSTILGDALVRMLRFVGHERVIGDNHIGDWGTQFGLLIAGMQELGTEDALQSDPLPELERIYKAATQRAKDDPSFADRARTELAKLQQGDPENRRIWQRFVDITLQELNKVYERLGVRFDEWLGESAYEDMLPDVVQRLMDESIAVEDQGAACVFFNAEDDPQLAKLDTPFIVRKKDGAFNYATTDVATLLYRREHFDAQRVLYVVDQRQALHFKQLFAVARKLGLDMRLEHVGFGTILGPGGKPLKTKEGGNIKLSALLDEAARRAEQRMLEGPIELDRSEIARLAPDVGIGAVKYADLRQNRTSDYRFDWEKMISFKGNAGPYLQYAHARVRAIFRKGHASVEEARGAIQLQHAAEVALGKTLLRFADAVHQAAETNQPHLIADHLYGLAQAFSVFYERCPVLKAEQGAKESRLALAALTARQLQRGLGLLGIAAPERM